jgi:hypothetical protein
MLSVEISKDFSIVLIDEIRKLKWALIVLDPAIDRFRGRN